MTNRQYLLLAKNMAAVMSSYGTNTPPPYATFDGNLANAGEILTLIKPGTNSATDVIVDKVRYENRLPWSPLANGTGASLQLIDADEDNSRSSEWIAGAIPEGWRQATFNGQLQANNGTNFFLWLSAAGEVYIDDIVLTYSNQPAGPNFLQNGDFESPLTGPWIIFGTAAGTNHGGSQIVSGISRTGNNSLRVVATGAGAVAGSGTNAIRQTYPSLPTNTTCTLTFWFLPGTNVPNINVRTLAGSGFAPVPFTDTRLRPPQNTSPGYVNIGATDLPAYDPLWLNELQAVNTTGPMDNTGEREPWIELYNASTNTINLDGYYLANNYDTNLTQWLFPAGSSIGPGQFKVIWADGETNETTMTHIHAGFRLNASTGSVALVRLVSAAPQITDYLTYTALPANASYGDYPDGQPFHRFIMPNITPGGTNIARPVNVFINEWMAANTNTIADPTEFPGPGAYDDWFELYNAGTEAVDLGGYFLTDNLGNEDQFMIPTNGQYVIPAGGFLLVWADNDDEINSPGDPDLHVNFALGASGDAIGLFAPDAITLIDSVTFGSQTNDISQGRFPDGAAPPFPFMTSPTPRNPNTLGVGNTAPTLAVIPNYTIRLGETVMFTAMGSDAEAPPQVLSYFLNGVPPAGAGINQLSGQFTWTPSAAQAPGMYTLTVRVQDNGAPVLSATRSFNVSVLLPPGVTLGAPVGNQMTISFDTISGRTYQVEWTEQLESDPDDIIWTPLNPPGTQLGTGSAVTINDPTDFTTRPRRFYRILETN
jgi:hypothetical protein